MYMFHVPCPDEEKVVKLDHHTPSPDMFSPDCPSVVHIRYSIEC